MLNFTEQNVADRHAVLTFGLFLFGLVTGPLLLLFESLTAPYGRWSVHDLTQHKWWWGPWMLDAKIAWMTQELPALLVPVAMAVYAATRQQLQLQWGPRAVLAAAFICHYFNRSLIYPWRIRGGKQTAFTVWVLAAAFCTCNGFMQGYFLLHQLPADMPWQLQHWVGLLLWLAGWLANLHCDYILRNLRSTASDTGYRIPHGGLFEYVSAANYFAETVEWLGFAIAAWDTSLAPWVFAWTTVCNLAPRAASHHAWYREKFKEEYPAARKAFIPFVW